jgi:hypothetical protein
MTGDERRRFCEHCQLHVHNLTAMSEREQIELLSRRDEKNCITYIDRSDALHVRTDSWIALQRLLLPFRGAALLLATLLPSLFTGCATTPQPEQPPTQPPAIYQPASDGDGKRTMGAPCYNPPLWRKIFMFWKY